MNKYDVFHLIKKKKLVLISLISTLYREFSFPKVDLARASGLGSLSALLQKGYYPKQLDSIMWLVHWDTKLLLEWTLLMAIYMSTVCGQEVGRTQLHVEIVSINITHFSLWNMLPNPAGPPIIMAAPQIHFRLFWDTDHTAKGNTKSSPILNYCEISIRRLSWGCSIQIQFGNIFSAHNSIWIWKLWKSFVN